MEKECPYCKKVFEIQRMDSVYCSRSCRQMAYMERKMERLKAEKSNGAEQTKEEQEPTDLLPIIQVKPLPQAEEEYKAYNSKLLDTIRQQVEDDSDMSALHTCIQVHQDIHSYWVGLRLRCLAECLLLFSEAKFISVADLMEICNAFTHLQRSIHYQSLPDLFPYRLGIDELRNKLRRLCLKAQNAEQIKFRLEQKDKINVIVTRYGLAQFFPKRRFSELEFSMA